ncbi:MAG: hypothetical protein ABEJ36_02035 [Candidatus Nanosalina sp.]
MTDDPLNEIEDLDDLYGDNDLFKEIEEKIGTDWRDEVESDIGSGDRSDPETGENGLESVDLDFVPISSRLESVPPVTARDSGSVMSGEDLGLNADYDDFELRDFEPTPYAAFVIGMMANFDDPDIGFIGDSKVHTGNGLLMAEQVRAGDAVEIQYEGDHAAEMSYLDFTPKDDMGEVEVVDGQVCSTGYPSKSRDLEDLDDPEDAYKMVVTSADDAREIVDQYDSGGYGSKVQHYDGLGDLIEDIEPIRELDDDDPVWG